MKYLPNWITSRPSIVGADFAGTVADTNGSLLATGGNVFGWNPMCECLLATLIQP